MQRSEMLKLIEITSHAIKKQTCSVETENDLKIKIHEALDEDISKINKLNAISGEHTFPFRFNKLLDLFTQAKKYIDLNWKEIKESNAQKLLFKSNGVSWEGTSMLNYMQTSLLEILSVIYETPISDLECLQEAERSIYQSMESPNIQSIRIIHPSYREFANESTLKKYEFIKNWRWSFEDKLMIPSLGFAFGGSRVDIEFTNKLYKLHDCSSFVGDFLGFLTFTTKYLKVFFDGEIEGDLSESLDELKLKLAHKTNNVVVLPEAGNIFIVQSLCGFVVNVDYEKKTIQTLSFTRHMPFIEGLVRETFMLNNDGKWSRKYFNDDVFEDLKIYVSKTNENSFKLPLVEKSAQMHFFEIIRDI
jgi:hypothetical protein